MKRSDIKQRDVFISWTRADQVIKNQIAEYLKANGIQCIESEFECSGDYRQWSREAVSACSVFLLIYTENTITSRYVPIEIEEYKKLDDYNNRILTVCSNNVLYENDPWGLHEYGNAVFLEGSDVYNKHLSMILHKVESLIVNRLDKIYRRASQPDCMKLIPFYKIKDNHDKVVDYSDLYVTRTLTEIGNDQKDITTLLKSSEILFISGPAGSGKTSFINQIRENASEDELVISLSCHKLSGTAEDVFMSMYSNVARLCGNRSFFTHENFKSILNSRQVVLILDGMDEIATEMGTRKFLKKVEEYYKANHENTTLIFTSRNERDADLITMNESAIRSFHLDKMKIDEVEELILKLFRVLEGKGDSCNFYRKLFNLHEDIKYNPLMITQLAIIYRNSGEFPGNVTEIYEAISKIILKFDADKEMQAIPENYYDMVSNRLVEFLKKFSVERYKQLSKGENKDAIKIFSAIFRRIYGDESKARADFIIEYLQNRAIMIDKEFYHKMFLEYWVAEYYYEHIFNDYDEFENYDILKELISHYDEPYWEMVIKLFLLKADRNIGENSIKNLYYAIVDCGICEYSLFFDLCYKMVNYKEIVQEILVSDILIKSSDGRYQPYGALFWYISRYELYRELLIAVKKLHNKECYPKALALVRDVCFILGQKNFAYEVAEEIDSVALFEKAEKSLTGVRRALCELFFTGDTAYAKGDDIYPRCFNVAEAKSLRDNGYGLCGKMKSAFKDELGLYSHESYNELNGEYIGLLSCLYDVNEIKERFTNNACQKVCGVILSITQNIRMQHIDFPQHVKILYLPENISQYDIDWKSIKWSELYLWSDFSNTYCEKKCYWRDKLVIPEGTRKIQERAFKGCVNLSEICIPSSVVKIGDNAFEECEGLLDVYIPDSITEMGKRCFANCTYLSNIHISNNLTKLEDGIFANCTYLSNVFIPEKVSEIGNGAFAGCRWIDEIHIPSRVKRIGAGAFSFTRLQSIHIPDGILEIAENTFSFCERLWMIDIPDSVMKIGDGAFKYCKSLTQIRIPNSITEIGFQVFEGCNRLKVISNMPMGTDVSRLKLSDDVEIQWNDMNNHSVFIKS